MQDIKHIHRVQQRQQMQQIVEEKGKRGEKKKVRQMQQMKEKVLKTINTHSLIESGESILIGVSGGPDSVCLLHILHSMSQKLGIKIFVAHINHMLRGTESDMDEEFVKNLCKELGINLFSASLNISEIAEKENISIEEAARKGRYNQFDLFAKKIGNCKIAVAHNKNDQAETIMMNIIRGTGLDGLKGMDYIRENIIRPLLDIDRDEIEEYCRKNNLNPRTDSTNLKTIYTRNKVRLELIPFITRNFNTDIVESVNRMAGLVRDDYLYLESITSELYNECLLKKSDYGVELDIEKINEYHNAIRKRVIRQAIDKAKGNLTSIESVHVDKIIELCMEGRTGAEIHLPQGVRVRKSYNILKIYVDGEIHGKTHRNEGIYGGVLKRDKEKIKFFKKVLVPGITILEELDTLLEAVILDKKLFDVEIFKALRYNSLVQFFDYDKLCQDSLNKSNSNQDNLSEDNLSQDINIRSRQEGDIFSPYKCKGTQKLKKFFINNKVPREIRDTIPLVAKGKEIVWVVGYKISDKFKITENTRSILRLEYRKNYGKI